MGYSNQVYLKTTTEGYVMLKQFNDNITNTKERFIQTGKYPLGKVNKSPSGNYKISWEDVKWYDSYPVVKNLFSALGELEKADIPYSYIRIGEEAGDVEHKQNYLEDMPYEIKSFTPIIDVYDEDIASYEEVPDTTHIVDIMFDLFDKFKAYDDIKDALRNMNSSGEVSDEEYDFAIAQWNEILRSWEDAQ